MLIKLNSTENAIYHAQKYNIWEFESRKSLNLNLSAI